eukprot:SM000304S11860  [mRNA]  locus=s304:85906:87536:- [translate_table: standard]
MAAPEGGGARLSLLVALAIVLLGCAATGLGIAAEAHRSKASERARLLRRQHRLIPSWGALGFDAQASSSFVVGYALTENAAVYCSYTPSDSSPLAAIAAALLAALMAVANYFGGCLCCLGARTQPGKARTWAFIMLLLAWTLFCTASALLIAAAVDNQYHSRGVLRSGLLRELECDVIKENIFTIGAVFSFLTMTASLLFYIFAVKAQWPAWSCDGSQGSDGVVLSIFPANPYSSLQGAK